MNRRSILFGCVTAGAAAAMARPSLASILLTGGGKPAGAGAAAAITSLTVVGATPLLDQSSTTDFGDATARVGINGDGWVCKAVLPWLTGATFLPDHITFTLSDPGFDASGTVTRVRTVRGGKILRRQYTPGGAQANNQEANAAGVDTVFFSLIADSGEFATVYQGTTITAANAASGFYGVAASGAVSSLTNSSTRPYYKPGFAWLNRQHEVGGAGGQYVEAVAMHKHAQGGRQVARIEFIAHDSQATPNVAATQTASVPTLSTLCTKGQPPEVYAATIPVTALTQADLCFVDAKVYPFIGDSSAVLTLSTDGFNATGVYNTAHPQTPLRFVNDKTGVYGAAHVSVKVGASGGTAQSSESASRATPFPNIRAALLALATFNAGRRAAADNGTDGSHVWLMDDGAGGAVTHHPGANPALWDATINFKALNEIRQSPANTAIASIAMDTASIDTPWGLSWHVDILCPATGSTNFDSFDPNAGVLSYYCDGTYTQNGTGAIGFRQLIGLRNLTHTGSNVIPPNVAASGSASTRVEVAMWVGYVLSVDAGQADCCVRAVIGCVLTNCKLNDINTATLVKNDSQDGKIIVNNRFMSQTAASILGGTVDLSRGLFLGQNVWERKGSAGPQALSIADLGTDNALDNVVVTANTIAGDRLNLLYTDTSTKLKRATTRLNLLDQRNSKTDLYTTDATTTGRTGSWAYIHGVDNWDVSLDGDSNHIGVPAPTAWLGELWANPTMAQVTRAAVGFTSNFSEQGSPTTGGGTYSLTGSSNAAYNTVPAGFSAFKYDIAGVLRKNDGSGAAGAYERTV